MYPLSRRQENDGGDSLNKSNETLENEYKAIHQEFVLKTRDYDDRSDKYMRLREEVKFKRQALDAFKETVKVCEEHLKLQEKMQTEALPHEKADLLENNSHLVARVMNLRDAHTNLREILRNTVESNLQLEREITKLKSDIIDLYKRKDRFKV